MAARQIVAQLADRLEEGQPLDVAHRAANFHQHEVDMLVAVEDEFLDVIGHMGDHLHGAAEIIAPALLGDDLLIDAPGGDIVLLGGGTPGEALVMAQIKVSLGAVVGHEDLAVLSRAHGARIDVEIGVEFAQAYCVATRLKEGAESRRRQAFAKRRDHAAGDENVPRHGVTDLFLKKRFGERNQPGRDAIHKNRLAWRRDAPKRKGPDEPAPR